MEIDPEKLTDSELCASISQLQSESVIPGADPRLHDMLDEYYAEADERGLFV